MLAPDKLGGLKARQIPYVSETLNLLDTINSTAPLELDRSRNVTELASDLAVWLKAFEQGAEDAAETYTQVCQSRWQFLFYSIATPAFLLVAAYIFLVEVNATGDGKDKLRNRGEEARRQFGVCFSVAMLCLFSVFALLPPISSHEQEPYYVLAYASLGCSLSLSMTAVLKIVRQQVARERAKEAWFELAQRPLFGGKATKYDRKGQGLRQFAALSADTQDKKGFLSEVWGFAEDWITDLQKQPIKKLICLAVPSGVLVMLASSFWWWHSARELCAVQKAMYDKAMYDFSKLLSERTGLARGSYEHEHECEFDNFAFGLKASLPERVAQALIRLYELLDTTHGQVVLTFLLLPVANIMLSEVPGWLQEHRDKESRQRDVREARFMETVNISLNYVEDSKLKFRTLCEVNLKDLLQNSDELSKLVSEAAGWVDAEGKHPFFLWRVAKNTVGR